MLYTYKEIYKYKINEQEYLTYSVSTFPKDNLPHFPKGKKKKSYQLHNISTNFF